MAGLIRSGAPILVIAVCLGVAAGVGVAALDYGEGLSYFSTDPRACANCHIMQPQYDSWQKSSHHTAAVCVDCHLPRDFVGKYIAKADNGYRHSRGFTLQDFHEPIVITESNRRILEHNCRDCHAALVADIVAGPGATDHEGDCLHCHWNVGHGPRAAVGGPESSEERSWEESR